MDAATVALIGVVVGALLGGGANLVLERYKQLKLAQSARKLIAAELGSVADKLQFAIKKKLWWAGELPTDQWRAHAHEITLGLSAGDFEKLAALHESIAQWNIEREADDWKRRDKLEAEKSDVEEWRNSLNQRYHISGLSQVITASKVALVIIIALAIISALDALLLPRPDINPGTIAAAIESQLGSQDFVDCTPSGVEWSCTDHRLSAPRTTCQIGEAGTSAQLLAMPLAIAASAASPPCTQTSQKYIASVSGDQVVATPVDPTQGETAPIYRGAIKQRNLLGWFWDWLRNSDP